MSALYTCIVYTTHTIDTGEYLYWVRETTVFCVYVAQSLFNGLAVYWKRLAFNFHRKLTTQIMNFKTETIRQNSNKNLHHHTTRTKIQWVKVVNSPTKWHFVALIVTVRIHLRTTKCLISIVIYTVLHTLTQECYRCVKHTPFRN